jgi:PilZ domain
MGIEDRRAHPRVAVDEQAWLSIVEHGLAMPCRILDLSMQGCRVRAGGPLPQGLQACVEITFTINRIPFRLGGRVMRSSGNGELGIAFVGMSLHRQTDWAEVVDEVQALATSVQARANAPEAA